MSQILAQKSESVLKQYGRTFLCRKMTHIFRRIPQSNRGSWVLALLLTLFAAHSLSSSLYRWGFSDEIGTIADGYSHLFFDFRMGQNNPPLAKQIMTFPLLFLDLDFPVNEKAWAIGHNANGEYSTDFFFKNRVSHEKIVLVARSMNVLLGCILGFFVYLWAKNLWGISEAFCALLLYTLWPAIISFSSVAQTDIAISLFFFLSLYSFWRYQQQPNTKRFLLLTLSTGCAFATKVTALLIPPIQFLISSIKERSFFNKRFISLSVAWSGALLLLSLDYGIFGIGRYIDTFRWVMGNTLGIRESTVYLFGENYTNHILYYFAVFFLKNPIPLIFLSLTGIYLNRKDKSFLYLALPALLLFISASRSHLQQGERFILPLYPFLALFGGFALHHGLFHAKKRIKILTCTLLLWLIGSNLVTFPYTLTYINELGGGSKNGWKYLGFLEGGQDIKGVVEFLKGYPNSTLLCAFNYSEILDWTTPHGAPNVNRKREFLAIGLSSFSENNRKMMGQGLGWLLANRTPLKRVGSIWIYDVTKDSEARSHLGNLLLIKKAL